MIKELSSGFTLIELITALLIAAVFITIAVPGYYSLIQNNKVVSVANKLSASFNQARMEAVKRGVRVSVCPAGNVSFTACGNNTQWQQGWIVFTDADNNNAIDSTDDLVKIAHALPSGITITTTSSIVSYDGTGFVTSGALSMSLSAAGCTGNNARTINIASGGRLSIANAPCN